MAEKWHYERMGFCNRCGKCCEKLNCSHYKGNGVCDIHKDKPSQCKEYPTIGDLLFEPIAGCSYYLVKVKDIIYPNKNG